jgi:hypothetical protein
LAAQLSHAAWVAVMLLQVLPLLQPLPAFDLF